MGNVVWRLYRRPLFHLYTQYVESYSTYLEGNPVIRRQLDSCFLRCRRLGVSLLYKGVCLLCMTVSAAIDVSPQGTMGQQRSARFDITTAGIDADAVGSADRAK